MIVQTGEKIHNQTRQREKQYLSKAGVIVEFLQVYILADVGAGREDKNRTQSHQHYDYHRYAVGDRIISHREYHLLEYIFGSIVPIAAKIV